MLNIIKKSMKITYHGGSLSFFLSKWRFYSQLFLLNVVESYFYMELFPFLYSFFLTHFLYLSLSLKHRYTHTLSVSLLSRTLWIYVSIVWQSVTSRLATIDKYYIYIHIYIESATLCLHRLDSLHTTCTQGSSERFLDNKHRMQYKCSLL